MSHDLSSDDAREPHSQAHLSLAVATLLWPSLPDLDFDVFEEIYDFTVGYVKDLIRDGFDWLLEQIASGILGGIDKITSVGYEQFLFYPNPATVPVLDQIWWLSVGIFSLIAGISFLYMLLMAQFFPSKDKADLQYFLERFAKYFVIVLISREVIAFFVSLTHLIASVYYQAGIDMSVGTTIAMTIIENYGPEKSLLFMILSAVVLMFASVGFLVILVMRILIVYVTFALLPLLMGFKLVEIGPWGIVNDMGEKFIKATAKMMVLGILITTLLWASTLAFDYSEYDSNNNSPLDSSNPVNTGNSDTHLVKDFMLFATPLLMINFIGFKIIMGIV